MMLLKDKTAKTDKQKESAEGFEASAQYLPIKARQSMVENRLKAVKKLNPIDPLGIKKKDEDALWKTRFETERKTIVKFDINEVIDKYYAPTD